MALKQECVLKEKLQAAQAKRRFAQANIIGFDEILLKKQYRTIKNKIYAYYWNMNIDGDDLA